SGDVVTIGEFRLQFHDPASTAIAEVAQGLAFNDSLAEVRIGGELVNLPPKEYVLLRLLMERPGQVCGREEIARGVWPEYEGQVADYNIDNLVTRLRHKI